MLFIRSDRVVGKIKWEDVFKAPVASCLAQKYRFTSPGRTQLKNCASVVILYISLAICNFQSSSIIQTQSRRNTVQNVFLIISEFKGFCFPAPFPGPAINCKKVTRHDKISSADLWNKDLKHSLWARAFKLLFESRGPPPSPNSSLLDVFLNPVIRAGLVWLKQDLEPPTRPPLLSGPSVEPRNSLF